MRMKTRVFNCTSKWLQLAEVHWQSAGERKKKNSTKIHDIVSSSVQFSSVQSLSRTGYMSVQKFQVCLSFQLTFTGTGAKKQPTSSTLSPCTNKRQSKCTALLEKLKFVNLSGHSQLLWNPKVNYHVHKIPPFDRIQKKQNSRNGPMPHFSTLNTALVSTFHTRLRLPTDLYWGCHTKISYAFLIFSM